ncbi:hypothetical protein [Geofilum rubicundum]|uniref:hypothetical protein n=1 Tax=Geofilum rubicundum TaxID=472113 RepID=UPI000780A748|nr:hypothetical protein [Geofilum rubicundum]
MIEFPVTNREEAIKKGMFYIAVFLVFSFIYSAIVDVFTVGVILFWGMLIALFLINKLKKQNITRVVLEDEELVIDLNGEVIRVSCQEISKIQGGIGGIGINGKMSKCYTVFLKREFKFGNKIYLTYRTHNTTKKFIEEDFPEIEELKSKLS